MTIGTNPEDHAAQRAAWERGYREAVLDVYVFLTGNPQALDLDTEHFGRISAMVDAVNAKGGRLRETV
jgi:hypothetical protein